MQPFFMVLSFLEIISLRRALVECLVCFGFEAQPYRWAWITSNLLIRSPIGLSI